MPRGHDTDARVHVRVPAESLRRKLLAPLVPFGSRTMACYDTCGGCLLNTMHATAWLAQLRRQCRRRRRELSPGQQRAHQQAFATLSARQVFFRKARHIATYIAADGELDPSGLLTSALAKQWYLPVLRPKPHIKLWFARYRPGQDIRNNRFGIPEPPLKHRYIRPPWALDLVLMPLVGFDAECKRLGMGGGFYDRTLAYLRHRTHWRKPLLVGVSHECQRLDALPVRAWDIPLDYVITETGVYSHTRA